MSPRDEAAAEARERERLIADAHALTRLAATPEWAVLARLLREHAERLRDAVCQRGLDFVQTEGLRAELQALEWLRARPAALEAAVAELDALDRAASAAVASPVLAAGPEPFETWHRRQEAPR